MDRGESTEVTTGVICAADGQVAKTGRELSVEELEDDDKPVELLVDETGNKVKVCPSVVMVIGDVTDGKVTVSPSASVVVSPPVIVIPPGTLLLVSDDKGGTRVNVKPSVVKVVGDVTDGKVMVSPFGRVLVSPPLIVMPLGAVLVDLDEEGGTSVNVWPSVTKVVGDVTMGRVSVSPSGSVVVPPPVMIPSPELLAELDADEGGKSVNVSPSVTRVVGAVRLLGRVTGGFVPIMTMPELEMMV